MQFAKLLVLTTEPQTITAVQAAVKTAAASENILLCKSMVELRSRLAQGEKIRTAALVDIGEDPPQILFELTKTVTAHPDTPFVVLSEEFDEKRVLQAMQAGARHFLRKAPSARSWIPFSAGCSCRSRPAPCGWGTWSRSFRAAAAAGPRPPR